MVPGREIYLSIAMRIAMFAMLFTQLAATVTDDFPKYDADAVKRFDDELRRLGIVLPPLSKPDEPVNLPDPIVSSPAGNFEGYWTKSQFGRPIAAFEGIRYAQPPVGPLRFRVAEPYPVTSELKTFKAKKPGQRCLQRDLFAIQTSVKGDEDCLFLNVYVPEKVRRGDKEKLPVMIFVHGGGFVVGQGSLYKSNILLDKDVTLVTINYRLGPLGFLTTEDNIIPGNLGLKDQVEAIRWVKRNIESFGGDPDLITVFGQSAGSISSEFVMTSPLTKGWIHRVIAMSGSSFAPFALARPGEMAENRRKAAGHLGCPAEPSDALLLCLQGKTAEEITAVDFNFRGSARTLVIPFKPVVEGDIPGAHIPHHPEELFDNGPANDVPYMTGITSEEGTFFLTAGQNNVDLVLNGLNNNFIEYAAELFILTPEEKKYIETLQKAYFSTWPLTKENMMEVARIFTDIFMLQPALKFKRRYRNGTTSPTYLYYFAYKGSRSFLDILGVNGENYGVSHCDDLFYLFSLPRDLKPSPPDVLMSIIVTDLFTSFARDGIPSSNYTLTKWEPVTTKGDSIEFLHFMSPLNIIMQKDVPPEKFKELLHMA